MRPRSMVSIAAAVVFWWVSVAGSAQAQFDELFGHLPDSTNALVLFNIQKLLDSPMARQEGWREDAGKRFTAGLISIPPGASQLVIAAQMDFRTMRPIWELALLRMDSTPPLSELARRYGGTIDTVAGAAALRLPDDSYLVRFSDRCLGGFTPANRQMVSQWIRGSGKNLSPYLQEAAGYATAGTQMIMALDMADVAALGDVQEGIRTLDTGLLNGAKIDPAELARLLQGVKGLMLGVKFEKRAFGKIKLDLQQDASLLSGITKPLFLAMVAQRGLMLNEFEDWKTEVEGNRVMFGGYLSSSGLTRLSSLIDLPTSALCGLCEARPVQGGQPAAKIPAAKVAKLPEAGGKPVTPPPDVASKPGPQAKESGPPQVAKAPESSPRQGPSPGDASAGPVPPTPEIDPSYLQAIIQSTQQYFHSTGHLLNDLRGRNRTARTMGQVGQWYQNYAQDRSPSPAERRRSDARLRLLCGQPVAQGLDVHQGSEHPLSCGTGGGCQPACDHDDRQDDCCSGKLPWTWPGGR